MTTTQATIGEVLRASSSEASPIKMRLTLSDSSGMDVNARAEAFARSISGRMEMIRDALLNTMKDELNRMVATKLQSFARDIELSSESRRVNFISSLMRAEEDGRMKLHRAKFLMESIQASLPSEGPVDSWHKKMILSDLNEIENIAKGALERIRSLLKSVEDLAIGRVEQTTQKSVERFESDVSQLVAKKKVSLTNDLHSLEDDAKRRIGKIKDIAEEFYKTTITSFSERVEVVLGQKLLAFDLELRRTEDTLKALTESVLARLRSKEEQTVSKSIEKVASFAESKKSEISDALSSLETSASCHMQRVESLIESMEHNLLTRVNALVDSLLEKKKTAFLAGMWVGTDLGSMESPVRHIHMKGEAKGLRLENLQGNPQSSGATPGRLTYHLPTESLYLDCGHSVKRISSNKVVRNITWPSQERVLHVDLSKDQILDARDMIWQLCDNENGYERVRCRIRTPDKKKLTIEAPQPLAPGAYRLIGVE